MENQNLKSKLKICQVQFMPEHKNPTKSIETVREIMNQIQDEKDIDLILLPEMALLNYYFLSKEEIEPFLEIKDQGLTYQFCAELAKQFDCYVFSGYQEKEDNNYYNSQLGVDPQGNLIANYRKHNLYIDDTYWAIQGDCFQSLSLKFHKRDNIEVKVSQAICADIDPVVYPDNKDKVFELGDFVAKENAQLVLFTTAWVFDPDYVFGDDEKSRSDTHSYWIRRLKPKIESGDLRPTYFIAADRCGEEKGHPTAGSSCVIQLTPKVEIINSLSMKETNYIITEIDI
ncbi:carbon-nitrogen family protein [Stylonychia lemnae]|uniref:Carbon-nitrogen family protein n=1 Tax=Stylonychia lemnae TaxID=5949 RepID=A0A078A5U7_STYLE|nr:carbon-nitrogen family protein [Stylonychia lemnae]|eukprot:CDW76134.1 carbon-nitrogen family protein [Stylonychia lemnae]